MRLLLLSVSALLISGCLSLPQSVYVEQFETHRKVPIADTAIVLSQGGNEYSGNKSTMVMAGPSTFVSVPTGKKQDTYGLLRREGFSSRFASLLAKYGYYSNAESIKEGESSTKTAHSISLDFKETFVGRDGWPFSITLGAKIVDEHGNTVLDKIYSESVGIMNGISVGCGDCGSVTIAEKEITQKIFKDLDEK